MAITYLKVNKDLLISILSFADFPSAPVMAILSEPAKSTKSNFDVVIESGFFISTLSIFNSKIEWLLEEVKFNLWLAVTLFFTPYLNRLITSSVDLHSVTNKFSTVNYSLTFHLNFSPPPYGPNLFVIPPKRSYILSLYICK